MSDTLKEVGKEWLLYELEEISEDHYCAGWMMNLEYDIWHRIQQLPNEHRYGMGTIPEKRLLKMKEVAEQLDGWWIYRDDRVFVPMAEWLPMYKAHAEKHGWN
jgi:hypothetical protein